MKGRLRSALGYTYDSFSSSHTYQNLKKVLFIRKLKVNIAHALWRIFPAKYKLHNDPILHEAFKYIVKDIKATSIVETGTFMGYSTSFMADNFPNIPIYTCEIDVHNYAKACRNLSEYNNVKIFKGTSPKFLEMLIKKKLLGKRPVFFLDAHWLDNWPIKDEIKLITSKIRSAVIIIDDFKIPGKENEFYYDKYGERECSLEFISPSIKKKNKYHLLLPNYGAEIFKKGEYHPILSGYPLIFQNFEKEFKIFSKKDFIKKFFSDKTALLKKIIS